MTRDEIAAAWKAALERKQARKQEYTTYTDAEELRARLEGVTLERVGLYAPDYKDPRTAAEWWDDRIAERNRSHWDFPQTPLLATLAVLLHDGDAGGARAALKAARGLEPAVQWCAYRNLLLWRGHADASRFGAERAVDQVLAEWERLKLPTEDPAADTASDETADRRRRRRPWVTPTEAAS